MTMKKLCCVLLSLVCAQVSAGTQTWEFTNSTDNNSQLDYSTADYYGDGNTINMMIDGISLEVSGWSDTRGQSYTSTPETVEQAELVYYGSRKYGAQLGMINQDEGDDTPNHSIDSYDYNGCWGDDIDMVLLSFSEAVSLEGITIGWAREDYGTYDSTRKSDITAVAYTGDVNAGPNIANRSWSDIASDSAWTFVENLMDATQNSYHTVDNNGNVLSNFWLVGAYNPVFSNTNYSTNNDGFKLAGITTSAASNPPATPVPEPSALLLMLASLGLLVRKRQKNSL
jgi:hypothetical protein